MKRPKGAFGVSWGDPLEKTAQILGVACEQQYEWGEKRRFQVCRGQARLLDTDAWIEIVTTTQAFEGLWATFPDVQCDDLAPRVCEALNVPRWVEPIHVAWRSGELIRLEQTAAGCKLTVAGRALGAELQKEQLARAIQDFSGAFRS